VYSLCLSYLTPLLLYVYNILVLAII
jgi:hypothetical protein